MDLLPEDCFSHILSFTSPKDACCTSTVSSLLRSSADIDSVWENYLPSDYQEILSRLLSPIIYSTKKELFIRLCNPHFIDEGRKLILLEKSTGKKCYILSSRELSISLADNHLYWSWRSHPQSRFPEVAELRTICWLQIKGKFNTQKLSPRTAYGANLIVKFAKRAHGLDTLPSETFLEVGNLKTKGKVYLRHEQEKGRIMEEALRVKAGDRPNSKSGCCREREDGWTEIELGRFYNDDTAEEEKTVEMGLKEVTGEHLKGGLIVEGIELRPISPKIRPIRRA